MSDLWPLNQPVYWGLVVLFLIAGGILRALLRRRLYELGIGAWIVILAGALIASVLVHLYLIPGR